MRISDVIAKYIMEALTASKGSALLSRSELAERFNCVPSQINYVLTTRFSPEHGYSVESRRGGGGYIRVSRVEMDRDILLMHVVNAVGGSIDYASVRAFLANLLSAEAIDKKEAGMIAAAVSDNALAPEPDREVRNRLRAEILKRCLLTLG